MRQATILFLLLLVGACSRSGSPNRGPHFGRVSSDANPTLSPANVTLAQGQTQTFTATGTGPYTWALQGGASGSIASSGVSTALYTAGSPGQAGATDTVTVTDTGAGNTTGAATVTISKGVNSFANYNGSGLTNANGFQLQNNARVLQKVGQTFQALAPTGGATTGMVTFVQVDMIRTSGGAGQNIKAEIHNLTGSGAIDDQGASNAFSTGSVDAQTALSTLSTKTKVLIPMTPGTALTVGTNYAVTIKMDVSGTFVGSVVATSANDPNSGVAWWFSKRSHAGGYVARGVVTSSPADYTKDTTHNISANVFIGEPYPAPTTSSISPTSGNVNDPQLTLTVNGTNFFGASVVNWAGAVRTTTYVSSTKLTATIPASDQTSAGTFNVTVTTPVPGGGTSGAQVFTVNSPNNWTIGAGIAAGEYHTCAIVTGGAQCWGQNTSGQLGNNSTTDSSSAVQVVGLTAGVQALALATAHACAIVSGGVQCWGENVGNGQLGNNSTVNSSVPVQVSGLTSGVEAIAAGGDHTCALVNGGVQCWGENTYGQLGNNTTTVSHVPVQVSGLGSGVEAITVGSLHSCALVNGGVQCWGAGNNGRLGNNSTAESHVPVQVSGLGSGVQAIAAGNPFTCALVNGGAQCWGGNLNGELGNNTTTDSLVPSQVTGMATAVQAISARRNSSCLMINGGIQCWGSNVYGQLGNNATATSSVPVQVQGLSTGVQAIASGDFHNCALVNGNLKCWGQDVNGQLGDGNSGAGVKSLVPVQVTGLTKGLLALTGSSGQYGTCAVVNGGVQCWGLNSSGEVGDNTVTKRTTPTQVLGLTSGAQGVAGGYSHHCALVNGGVQCWGKNLNGQIGDNTTTNRKVPTQVVGLTAGVQAVFAFGNISCAMINGGAQCWGENAGGQLGDNSTVERHVPVQVIGLATGVQSIAPAQIQSCALVNGGAKCWGDNGYGELGNNSTAASSLVPVNVTGLTSGVQSVISGKTFSCAIANGGVKCWGDGYYGNLGNNSAGSTSSVPVQVTGLAAGVQSAAAGDYQICGIVNGGLQCWGFNGHGALGDTTTTDRAMPVQPVGLTSGIEGIGMGFDHGCAIINGAAQCWGAGANGELGNNATADSHVAVAVSPFL